MDLAVPDLVPFVDEILLALGAALLGSWRERKSEKRFATGAALDEPDGATNEPEEAND